MALVVLDVNNKESFKSCSKWYQDVRDASPNHNIPGEQPSIQQHSPGIWSLTPLRCVSSGVLLANKTDLRYNNRDAISTKEAEEFAERNDLKYFECSAVNMSLSSTTQWPRFANNFVHACRVQQENSGVEAPFAYVADWFHKKYQAATQRA